MLVTRRTRINQSFAFAVGGLSIEFCMFVAGWRHVFRNEWPFIVIITIINQLGLAPFFLLRGMEICPEHRPAPDDDDEHGVKYACMTLRFCGSNSMIL